jgi:hypothetical protein
MAARRGRGRTLFWILSLLVVLSMICGTLFVLLPTPRRPARPTPTPVFVTPTPMQPEAPSPQPQPTA